MIETVRTDYRGGLEASPTSSAAMRRPAVQAFWVPICRIHRPAGVRRYRQVLPRAGELGHVPRPADRRDAAGLRAHVHARGRRDRDRGGLARRALYPRIGGWVVALWLWGIILNLLMVPAVLRHRPTRLWAVARRDCPGSPGKRNALSAADVQAALSHDQRSPTRREGLPSRLAFGLRSKPDDLFHPPLQDPARVVLLQLHLHPQRTRRHLPGTSPRRTSREPPGSRTASRTGFQSLPSL